MSSASPTRSQSKPPRQTAAQQQQQQQQRTWIKNHPLEGDGLVTGFYNFLHKRNTKTLKACKDVLVPDTIVYDHNFPRGWFTSDLKSKEISKKQGKELDAASIQGAFHVTPNPAVGVVACYMCSYEEDINGVPTTVTSVEFFNESSLEDFVGRKVKREGILQKFVVPKGLRNSVIQAVWSPRVCIVQRRTNRSSIKDRLQCDRDPYPCAVTYEGPSHFSEEGSCALHTTEQVKTICTSIVQHFYATEHKFITRMVLYFKVDERDQIWLLWCGSLRVSDRDQPSQMPLNLAPKFNSPSLEAATPQHEEEDLLDADMRHYHMSNDTLFHNTFVKPSSPRREHGDHGDGSGDHYGTGGSGESKSNPSGGRGAASKGAKQHPAAANGAAATANDGHERDEEWHKAPGIADQYRELCIDRDAVLSHLDDIFYEAYGHFLKHEPGPFNFEVERKIAKTLGIDVLQELMQALRIDHALSVDDGGTANIDDEELTFAIPVGHTFGPMTKVGDAAAKWVQAHYERRIRELREEAESMPAGSATTTTSSQPAPAAAAAPAPAAEPAAQSA